MKHNKALSIKSSLFDEIEVEPVNPYVKNYVINETSEDVLALSVAWKRIRDESGPKPSIHKLLDPPLFELVTHEDRRIANVIREYYSKKIMMNKLTETKEPTNFRKDLNKFIHGSPTCVTEEILGLVYYLPDFYEQDTILDTFKQELVSIKDDQNNRFNIPPYLYTMDLKTETYKPLGKLLRKGHKLNKLQYWMKNINDGTGALIELAPENPLLPLWHSEFVKPSITITAYHKQKKIDNFSYNYLIHFTVIKI